MVVASVSGHLSELHALLRCTSPALISVPARDSCVSIENTCKNALDDEIPGLASQLFASSGGLPALLTRSLEGSRCNEKPLRELRSEVLKLIDFLIVDHRSRETEAHIAEYASEIARICLHVFRLEVDSAVRVDAIATLLAAVKLRDHVPDLFELTAVLFPPDELRDPMRRPSAIDQFWGHLASTSKAAKGTSDTVRGACMRALGVLALLFPVSVCDHPAYEHGQLYRRCERALRDQSTGMPEITGALEGLDGLLGEASPTAEQVRDIFRHCLGRLSLSTGSGGAGDELKRFGAPKAALTLIGRHLDLFGAMPSTPLACSSNDETDRLSSSLLLQHGDALWTALIPLWEHRNAELHALADEVLRGAVAVIGMQINHVEAIARAAATVVPGAQGAAAATKAVDGDGAAAGGVLDPIFALQQRTRSLYEFLSGNATRRVAEAAYKAASSGAAEPSANLGLSMTLLGSFALPLAKIAGVHVVDAHLASLAEYASTYLQPEALRYYAVGNGRLVDRSARYLPPFLAAHAMLLEAASGAPDRSMETCSLLTLRLFSSIDALPESASIVRSGALAIQQLMMALHSKGDALHRFLGRFVHAAALITIDHAARARAQAATAGVEHSHAFFGGLAAKRLWTCLLDRSLMPISRLGHVRRRAGQRIHRHLHRASHSSAWHGEASGESSKQTVISELLSELLRSLTSMLRRLDLSATAATSDIDALVVDGSDDQAADPNSSPSTEPTSSSRDGEESVEAIGDDVLCLDGRQARNPCDLHIFLAITAFTDGLLAEVEPQLLTCWGHVLLLELISLSSRYPHVSGFYKLVRIVVIALDRAGYFDGITLTKPAVAAQAPSNVENQMRAEGLDSAASSTERSRCQGLLHSFLRSLHQRTRRFQDELLASALELLLAAPLCSSVAMLDETCSMIQLALSMGHTYQPLAAAALSSLERLQTHWPSALRPHLPQLLPCLHAYLATSSESTEREGSLRRERDGRRHRSASSSAALINSASTRLRRSTEDLLQQRIVKLLGTVGGDVVHLVHGSRAVPAAEGRWEITPRVAFKLPIAEEVYLHLDALLPRVVELATTSMIYREKAAACELLDAAIKLCIGLNADRPSEDWSAQYKHLFPAMIQLATDVDAFARSLFEPLTLQTIHWLTSANSKQEPPAVAAMLEAAMAAIADDSRSGARDFGARCLGEFIHYAVKHQRHGESRSALGVASLLSRLYSLAAHPSPTQRLGFAYAVNAAQVYRTLREDSTTLDIHVLELCQHAMLALRLAQTDPPALATHEALSQVLSHLGRMITRDAVLPLLCKPNMRRTSWRDGLQPFTKWLFEQCMQPRSAARLAATTLFKAIAPKLHQHSKQGLGAGAGSRESRSSVLSSDGTREWVHAHYGTKLSHLPIVRLFTPSGQPSTASNGVTSETAEPLQLSNSSLLGSIEEQCTSGAWSSLHGNMPAAAEEGSLVHEISWLEAGQAALDATYWSLSCGHLTTEALLSPTGSLRLVGPTMHALIAYILRRAPTAAAAASKQMDEQHARLVSHTRDTLKAAFRLMRRLIAETPPGASSLSPRLQSFLTPSQSPSSMAHGAPVKSPASVAMLAAFCPTRVGFDTSEIDSCQRMRFIACELCSLLHARQPEKTVAALRELLSSPSASLHTQPLVAPSTDALEMRALLEAYLTLFDTADGCLIRQALPHGSEALAEHLLRQVVEAPSSATPLEISVYSLGLRLALKSGVDHSHLLALLLDSESVVAPIDPGVAGLQIPTTQPASGDRVTQAAIPVSATPLMSRSVLFFSRFRDVLLPHLAFNAEAVGASLIASAATHANALALLLALFDFHRAHAEVPAEPLVRALLPHLPLLLAKIGWERGDLWAASDAAEGGNMRGGTYKRVHSLDRSLFISLISLFRHMLTLGGHIVVNGGQAMASTQPATADGSNTQTPTVLAAVVSLLRSANQAATNATDAISLRHAERLLTEGLSLLPPLVRYSKMRDSAQHAAAEGVPLSLDAGSLGEPEPLPTIRRILRERLPHSFRELSGPAHEDQRRRIAAVITPMLDCIADAQARPSALLLELVAMPALTECTVEGMDASSANPFADGMRHACHELVAATVAWPSTLSSAEGPAVQLWRSLCAPAVCVASNEYPASLRMLSGRWTERLALGHWVGLPLLHQVSESELIEGCLAPVLPALISILEDVKVGKLFNDMEANLGAVGSLGTPSGTRAAAVVLERLVRCTLACEVLGALMGRMGSKAQDALRPSGLLANTMGGADLFMRIVGLLSHVSSKPMELPAALRSAPHAPSDAAHPGIASEITPHDMVATAAALRRGLHAAAYSAFVEAVVQTQTKPSAVEKTILRWASLWDLCVDPARKYKLTATTAFEVTTEEERLALQGRVVSRRGVRQERSNAAYLPSQALLASSLSQDVSQYEQLPDAHHDKSVEESVASAAGRATTTTSAPATMVGEIQIKSETDESGTGAESAGPDADSSDGVVLVQGYELDELSTHPLMGTVLRMIAQLRHRHLDAPFKVGEISCSSSCACPCAAWPAAAAAASGMPAWMHSLLAEMSKGEVARERARRALERALDDSPLQAPEAELKALRQAEAGCTQSLNKRLIIARLVYNLTRQEKTRTAATATSKAFSTEAAGDREPLQEKAPVPSFERYARLWARPLLVAVLDSLLTDRACFHYLARDLIGLVVEWQRNANAAVSGSNTAIGNGSASATAAQKHVPPVVDILSRFDEDDCLSNMGASGDTSKPIQDRLLDDLLEKLITLCGDEKTLADASSANELLRENVRVIRLLIEGWPHRLHVRRLILMRLLTVRRDSTKEAQAAETRFRLSSLHILAALLANGFDLHDDPAHVPWVRGKDGALVQYKPVSEAELPRALLAQVADKRQHRKGDERKGPLTPRKALYQPAAAVLGMLMGQLHRQVSSESGSQHHAYDNISNYGAGRGGEQMGCSEGHAATRLLQELDQGLLRLLNELQDGTQDSLARLIAIVHDVSNWYPRVLLLQHANLGRYLLAYLTKVYGTSRVQVLDCLERCVMLESSKRDDSAVTELSAQYPSNEMDADFAPAFRVGLRTSELALVLQQQQAGVQMAALRLVTGLCMQRGPPAVFPYVAVLNQAFEHHKEKACRELHLKLLMKVHTWLLENGAATSEGSVGIQMEVDDCLDGTPDQQDANEPAAVYQGNILMLTTSALLRGLSDADQGNRCVQCSNRQGGVPHNGKCNFCDRGLRAEVIEYWHKHVLPSQLSTRLLSCFHELHAPEAEPRWLHRCASLLLELPLKAPNVTHSLFPKPLEEGLVFVAYAEAVPTAVSASAALRPWGSQSQLLSQEADWNGPLRATQSQLLFSQTQTQTTGAPALATYSTQDSSGGAAAHWGAAWGIGSLPHATRRELPPVPRFESASTPGGSQAADGGVTGVARGGTPSSQTGINVLLIGKRFKRTSEVRANASVERMAAISRRRALSASAENRFARVAAYRSYRKGELPDIDISPRDILAPLQALVQHDTLLAKLAFTEIYSTVRRDCLADAPSSTATLHSGMLALLSSRAAGPAFTGCLHELALSEEGETSWLPPALVATSAMDSGNLHSGILLLERHLSECRGRNVSHTRDDVRPAKRGKVSDEGSAAASDTVEMSVRMHLADLYRAVGDEDVVRGISGKVTSSTAVLAALAAETRGDAADALANYEHATTLPTGAHQGVTQSLTQWECSLVQRGRLSSLSLLCKWEAVASTTAETMNERCKSAVSTTDMAFDGSLAEPWVRLWIVSHSKLDAAPKQLGWGAWPGTMPSTASDKQSVGIEAPMHPAGVPLPSRDNGKLLDAGHGALLLLERLAADDLNGMRSLLPRCMHAFVRRWATLHPLAESARLAELKPLQILSEASELATLIESAPALEQDPITGEWVRSRAHCMLLRSWAARLPSVAHHDTCHWDDLICSRRRMLSTMRSATSRFMGEYRSDRAFLDAEEQQQLLESFDADCARTMLSLYESAAAATRDQGNFAAAEAYLRASAPLRGLLGEAPNAPRFVCSIFRLKLQRAQARSMADGSLVSSLDGGRSGSGSEWHTALKEVHSKAEQHAAQLSQAPLANSSPLAVAEGCELRALRAYAAWELAICEAESGCEEQRMLALTAGAYTMLKENADVGYHLERWRHAEMRMELVDLCTKAIAGGTHMYGGHTMKNCAAGKHLPGPRISVPRTELVRVSLEQLVRAMADGSLQARDRLPSVLALCRGLPDVWSEAASLLEMPPLWMFLSWAPQMIAMLYEPHGVVVAALLCRLAHAYPQALYFPFHVSKQALKKNAAATADPERASALKIMSSSLTSPAIERLVNGLTDLTHPNLRLKDLLTDIVAKMSDGDVASASALYAAERRRWLHPKAQRPESRGDLLLSFAAHFTPIIDNVFGQDGGMIAADPALAKKAISKLMVAPGPLSREAMGAWVAAEERKLGLGASNIKTFSASLAAYQRSDALSNSSLDHIELPGQYATDRPPAPLSHVQIEGFAPSMITMGSLRRPKQITIRGTDQREYRFLCKGGEDLRLDQRVQLLFGSMNSALQAHAPSASRGLSMTTYTVLPLSEHVGILEWVGQTKTLKSLITAESERRSDVQAARATGGRGRTAKNAPSRIPSIVDEACMRYQTFYAKGEYLDKLKTVSRETLTKTFDSITALVPPDLLSRAVAALSVSSEAYLAMRSRFARSLACLTVVMHVLGIGDRHLDNFLLHTASGRVVGIDFGHAFGSATYMLPVPELMAVRLTRQLTAFLQPLDTNVLLKDHMVFTLEALRACRADLMRTMEVFLSEPIVDWEAQTRKLSAEQRRRLEESTDPAHGPDGLAISHFPTQKLNSQGNLVSSNAPAAATSSMGKRSGSSKALQSGALSDPLRGSGTDVTLSSAWATERLALVESRLHGGHSAHLTMRELSSSAVPALLKPGVMQMLEDVVLGPPGCVRRQMPSGQLTVSQQVDVLIEQAMDSNILGRTYVGWNPFI